MAAGLLLAVLALLVAMVLLPWFQRIDQARQQVREASLQLARLEARAAVAPMADATATHAGAMAAALLLPAPSEAQAAALLQDWLKLAVGASGATLASIQALPVTPLKGVVRVGARLHLTADLAALQSLLHGLEAGGPLLLVDNLSIGARRAAAGSGAATSLSAADPAAPRRAAGGSGAASDRPLDVRLDVAGFAAVGGAK